MGDATPILEVSNLRPRPLRWACTTELAGMLLWGGAQTRFPWEIRTFLVFLDRGESSPSVSLCRQSLGLQPQYR